MGLFTGMNITSSALTAQRLRMDVISSNVANAETTRGKYVDGQWQPYQRKTVVLQTKNNEFMFFTNKEGKEKTGQDRLPLNYDNQKLVLTMAKNILKAIIFRVF